MVDIVIKVTKPEIAVTTANTVYDSVLFRFYTPAGGSDALITVKSANGDVIGSLTQPAGFVEVMNKNPTDTVESNTAVLCSPVAWK